MCGMIGSRQGWVEASYATLPAGSAAFAAALARVPGVAGDVRIVPGASGSGLAGAPDVMRGEETQIVGALESGGAGDGLFVLPGTHSKWAEVRDGRILRFATFLTGEAYGALRGHTILGRLMADGPEDESGFAAGLARAREPGGLLHHLFSARTLGLFDRLQPDALAPYLSGLLIGHEIEAARAAFGDGAVTIVGGAALARRYAAALGPRARTIAGDVAAARGLWRIAREAGLA
jgi:2-dehydro-3-deoxygalactonokinase